MAIAIRHESRPLGFQAVTGLSSAKGLTPPGGTQPLRAVIQAENQAVRWRDDGVNPSASTGMLLAAGATMEYDGKVSAIRFIEIAAGASLNVSFYE